MAEPADRARILVTGGSGFIGTNLIARLVENGYEIANFDLASPRDASQRHVWIPGDVRRALDVQRAFETFRPTVVIHLAARTDLHEKRDIRGYAANTEGVANVVSAVRSSAVSRAIFASSRLVVRIGYQPVGDLDYAPSTVYGASKVEGERIVRAAQLECEWVILRFTSIWGPWFGPPYDEFFRLIKRGMYVQPGRANPRKSFGYVGNTVFQLTRLIELPSLVNVPKLLWVADYDALELRHWTRAIARSLGVRQPRQVPLAMLRLVAKAGDIGQAVGWRNPPLTTFRLNNLITPMVYDINPLRELVGPLPYSLDEGVERTTDWMERRGKL